MAEEKRKLHIVHTESSQGWGGQEIRVLTEALALIGRGHRVTLVTPRTAQIFQAARKAGIPVVDLPIARKSISAILAMRSWLATNEIDVVNTHSSTDSWLVAIASLLLSRPPAVVRTRHISAPLKQNMATRWLYKSACWKVVTTGERLRQALMVEAGLPPEHLVSVPTGIDLSRFSPARVPRQDGKRLLGLPENALVLGIAATLRSWKGHDYLLEALSRLAAEMPRVRLLVAGDGPRRQHIESRIAELGVGDKVLMLGQRSDMPEVLAAMDVFVLPSYANEGVPQAIMQAMAMALPVVSTRVGAIDEAVIHEETGLLVEPRNPDALAEALSHLLSDEALRSRMGDAGRRRALERFSIQHMADRMEDIFRAAANA